MAGGEYKNNYQMHFTKICSHGNFKKMNSLLTGKAHFPMAYWKKKKHFFTLGGYNGDYLDEVTKYESQTGIWYQLPDLPNEMGASSATVFDNTLINIGGTS